MHKPVYNERYYKIQALLKNAVFQTDIAWLKDQFDKYGVSVPDGGFQTYKEYMGWNDTFWDTWTKREYSDDVKNLWKKYANPDDNKIYGSEAMNQYEVEKAELVPPVYGEYLHRVMREYGFDSRDKDLHEFLINHVFLGKNEITDPSFEVIHRRDEKTGQFEMFVHVFPWTTKDDIVRGWNFIRKEQEFHRKGVDRNQMWKNFDRDYHIYELYEQAREEKKNGDKRRLEEITYSLYYTETKDDSMDFDNIKRIVHEVRKRLGLSDELSDDNG